MNTAGKTLVILSPGFPANEADVNWVPFPQLFVKSMKRCYPALNVVVLSFQYPFFNETYNWFGVTVMPLNGRNKGKLYRLKTWFKAWQKISGVMQQNEVVGILNLWLGECAFIGGLAGKKYNVPYYSWLLGQDAKKGNSYVQRIKPKPKNLIALSDFLHDEFYKNYAIKPSHVIPLGIDTAAFTASTSRDIDVLGVGSLIPLKRYDLFIKVIDTLVKIMPDVRVVLCGNGPEAENLTALIVALKLSKNIKLQGEVNHNEVLQLMQRTKVFLHPSSYEGFATVFSEALYAGAHVVSFVEPMHTSFSHHHIVTNEQEMVEKTYELLVDRTLNHDSVLIYKVEEVCEKVLSLYIS